MVTHLDRDWGREGIGTKNLRMKIGMDMGIRMDVESGPSNHRSISSSVRNRQHRQQSHKALYQDENDEHQRDLPRRSKRRRSQSSKSSTSAFLPPIFLLPFLCTISAAPAPAPPPTRTRRNTPLSPSSTSAITQQTSSATSSSYSIASYVEDRKIQYLTSVSTPSTLPTNVAYVDETVLPYLLTIHEDGYWRRAEGGWSLYGRQVANPTVGPILADDDGEATATGTENAESTITHPSYAVESVLPNGWGISSNRTSIYKVPLIAIASVVIAMGIVALIIFIVISRKKKHRKQKRAKERLRRKALAAAGIKEEELNSSVAEAAFKEKLAELEDQHLARKKRNGQINFSKGKVRVWNQRLGMRKRKGKGKDKQYANDLVDQVEEEKPIDGVDEIQPSSPTSILDREVSRQSGDDQVVGDERGSGSRRSSLSSSRRTDRLETTSPQSPATEAEASTAASAAGVPYFPPAYRPASVRSLHRHNSAAASSAGPSQPIVNHDVPTVLSGVEKTQAPGYYPAPATEDGEVALAVASRSEGKARLIDPPLPEEEDNEDRMRHIATDDKRVLERMRLGASAPPNIVRSEPEEGDDNTGEGPSAPTVQVDDQGFEQLDESQLHVPNDIPLPSPTLTEGGFLPSPPRLNTRLTSTFDGIPTSPSMMNSDSTHLLPSAPPAAPLTIDDNVPSAPPLLDEDDEEDDATRLAPVFQIGEGEDDSLNSLPSDEPTTTEDDHPHVANDEEGSSGNHLDSESRVNESFSNALPLPSNSGTGVVFLPRYEP
ncbi:uncharacterized protein IL334_002446 [Kwoniella shivajii]|uniref:Uncharacterized protein n=1 Tax=Kwoniella shivajii TaxID=564305 RepID=A0ABZ1CVE8_9TREE|nr:hypothetical protein IL334_002446 [Kwoniella shivajii]